MLGDRYGQFPTGENEIAGAQWYLCEDGDLYVGGGALSSAFRGLDLHRGMLMEIILTESSSQKILLPNSI